MSNLNLKGIWIPIEILTDEKLSDKEKIIYSIILYLSKENSKQVEMRKLIPINKNTYLTKVKYPLGQNFNTPIEEKFKDNKYNNKNIYKYNNAKQNYRRSRANFEERDYTNYDFTKLYANVDMLV